MDQVYLVFSMINHGCHVNLFWTKHTEHAIVPSFQDGLERTVIEQGMFSKQLRVEVYPMELKLCLDSESDQDEESCITQAFSRTATIGTIGHLLSPVFAGLLCS